MSPEAFRESIEYDQLLAKPFALLDSKEKEEALKMRNHDSIRIWMRSSEIISLQDHLNFIEGLKKDEGNFYWLVFDAGTKKIFGVIYLNKVNFQEKTAEFGIYKNPFLEQKGIGYKLASMELYIIFEIAEFEFVTLDVQENNIKALKLYEKLGFVVQSSESPGYFKMIFYKSHWNGNKK